jgi:ABC-type uncharacterized transport system permease subunit
LPWASFIQAPIDVFLERPDASFWLVRQACWAVALFVIGRMTFDAATRRLVVQGG